MDGPILTARKPSPTRSPRSTTSRSAIASISFLHAYASAEFISPCWAAPRGGKSSRKIVERSLNLLNKDSGPGGILDFDRRQRRRRAREISRNLKITFDRVSVVVARFVQHSFKALFLRDVFLIAGNF